MKKWFSNFMTGRYGSDEFGRFLGLFACLLLVISIILSTSSTAGMILWALALVIIIYSYFRMFSKKINKRFSENYRFIRIKNKLLAPFKKFISRSKQKKTHKFFKCPSCKTTVRVPKNKGKIKITCPKCGEKFIKKT